MRTTRFVLVLALAVGVVAATGLPAGAWANGVDDPDAYGTHDWVLDQAVAALGADADWVCLKAALRATDDPDTKDGIDHASGTWWHVWDEWGDTWGGAPEAVQVWFDRTKDRLEAGKRCPASRALGIMAHLVADVAQPMHTDSSPREEAVHEDYEAAVDSRSEASDTDYEFTYDGTDTVDDPYDLTVAVARAAHPYYNKLIDAFDRHGYNTRVDKITKRELNVAANAIADLIAALS